MTSISNRRKFLTTAAGIASAGYFVSSGYGVGQEDREADKKPESQPAAEQEKADINVAIIGVGNWGRRLLNEFAAVARIAAVADVDSRAIDRANADISKLPEKPFLTRDFRELLDREDIDVFVIATPDHWHAPLAVAACQAGKDVYCETPVAHSPAEAKVLESVIAETGRVFQGGNWYRSDGRFQMATELVRQDRVGIVRQIDISIPTNPVGKPVRYEQPPVELDWDLWLGPAPETDYSPSKTPYKHRWWWDYSGGQVSDFAVPYLDIAGTMLDRNAPPPKIRSKVIKIAPQGSYPVPPAFLVELEYTNKLLVRITNEGRFGMRVIGSRGNIVVNRGALLGKSVDRLDNEPLEKSVVLGYVPDRTKAGIQTALSKHVANFIGAVENRLQTISPIKTESLAATLGCLANISIRTGKIVEWDVEKNWVKGGGTADELARPPRRGEFNIIPESEESSAPDAAEENEDTPAESGTEAVE